MLQISIRYVLYFSKIHSIISFKFLFSSPNRPYPVIVLENLSSEETIFCRNSLISDLPFLNTLLRRQKQRVGWQAIKKSTLSSRSGSFNVVSNFLAWHAGTRGRQWLRQPSANWSECNCEKMTVECGPLSFFFPINDCIPCFQTTKSVSNCDSRDFSEMEVWNCLQCREG